MSSLFKQLSCGNTSLSWTLSSSSSSSASASCCAMANPSCPSNFICASISFMYSLRSCAFMELNAPRTFCFPAPPMSDIRDTSSSSAFSNPAPSIPPSASCRFNFSTSMASSRTLAFRGSSLFFAEVLICLAEAAYRRVDMVSSSLEPAGEQHATMVVRALPDKDSRRYHVSTDSRNGTLIFFLGLLAFSTRALMHRPSTVRLLLMLLPSCKAFPTDPSLSDRSDPARSMSAILVFDCISSPEFLSLYFCCT
mmetsp:Transcript_24885/g.51109  ORF Transcript_24885/g.51109 Transcript_24885/m.51109 type:complete len:252 (+) Transcript_24885:573-1328(+)